MPNFVLLIFFSIFARINNNFMSNKAKFIVFLVALVAVFAACSLTIQIQRDNTNSTQTNSQETNQSADSTRVNLHLNP